MRIMYTTCFTHYNNKGVRHKKSRSFGVKLLLLFLANENRLLSVVLA